MLIANVTHIDLGTVKAHQQINFEFLITNDSNEPVHATPKASCGCTTPMLEKNPIQAQETTRLLCGFNGSNTGENVKYVYLFYEQFGVKQQLSLSFRANVEL